MMKILTPSKSGEFQALFDEFADRLADAAFAFRQKCQAQGVDDALVGFVIMDAGLNLAANGEVLQHRGSGRRYRLASRKECFQELARQAFGVSGPAMFAAVLGPIEGGK
jgi:hypothetical protein